jgi:hypothetical protein
MRNYVVIVFITFSTSLICQNSTNKYQLDQSDPKSVVNAIFYAARSGEYDILENLCDPNGDGDGDTKRICALTDLKRQSSLYGETDDMAKVFKEFNETFNLASVFGQISYDSLDNGDKIANVPFMFNHPGGENRSSEVMRLVEREGKWYLYSF